MKRPTYFISARSPSADILASELVLALREQFSKAEGFGIVGGACARTRLATIATLEELLKNGLHEQANLEGSGLALRERIEAELDKSSPQVAVLVGYSPLHDWLATYFKNREIPVVLYGMTPVEGWWDEVNVDEVGQRVDRALGMFPRPGEFVTKAGIPFTYVGSPFRDRTDRVHVSRNSLGLGDDSSLVTFLPGSRLATFRELFPKMLECATALQKKRSQTRLLLPLSTFVYEAAKKQVLDPKRIVPLNEGSIQPHFQYGPLTIMHSMTLEVLSVSDAAVTGCGAATIECCLFGVPFLPLHRQSSAGNSSQALLNQVWDYPVVREFGLNDAAGSIVDHLVNLMEVSPERNRLLKEFSQVKSSLHGFAAENAAEIIGQQVAAWHVKKRAKGSQSA